MGCFWQKLGLESACRALFRPKILKRIRTQCAPFYLWIYYYLDCFDDVYTYSLGGLCVRGEEDFGLERLVDEPLC